MAAARSPHHRAAHHRAAHCLAPRRLARSIVRQLRLKRDARVLDVGCGDGDVVELLRRAQIEAYGLFDGPTQERADDASVPKVQAATLHQSVPFLAQTFDAVIVRQTGNYEGLLSTPEACTATANLLAALKPNGSFVFCGSADFAAMRRHLDQFAGKGQQITLGNGGLLHMALRISGLAKPGIPALKFTIPHEAITRLEWHRMAREAVANLNRIDAEEDESVTKRAAESPAA